MSASSPSPGAPSFWVVPKLAVLAAAAATVATATVGTWAIYENGRLRRRVAERFTADAARSAALEQRIRAETARVGESEAHLTELLRSARSRSIAAHAGHSATKVTTTEAVEQAETEARGLIQDGRLQDALDTLVACYREVEPIHPGSSECQRLMSAILALGRKYPAARAALGQIRDDALTRFLADRKRHDLAFEIALLNDKLAEGARTLALYDQLPTDDATRQTVAQIAYTTFVQARRYEAALATRSLGQMLITIESAQQQLGKYPPELEAQLLRSVVDATTMNIEALTGAGRSDDARQLTDRLLAFDNSDATRVAIREHVERARATRQ